MKDEIIIRTYIVFIAFVLIGFVILGRVVQIGIPEGDRWRMRGDSLYVRHQPIEAGAGKYSSCDGRLLVTSVPLFDVRMDVKGVDAKLFVQHVDSLAYCLSHYVDPTISERGFRDLLYRERSAGNRYLMLKDDVSYSQNGIKKKFPLFRLGKKIKEVWFL